MPSASRNKGTTSPKERIIPIKIEGSKSKIKTNPVVIRYDPSDTSDAESVIVKDVAEETKASNKKSPNQWEVKVVESKQKKPKYDVKNSSKDKSNKKDSRKNVDVNKNLKESDKKKNEKLKNKSYEKSVEDTKEKEQKKKIKDSKHETSDVTITTQPSKSILKHPIASSTPIPTAEHESSWANQSTTSTGTVVKKPPSLMSRCWAWMCMPCGLCCACDPLECECCNFCVLRCSRCFQQCYCSCCNRKCC